MAILLSLFYGRAINGHDDLGNAETRLNCHLVTMITNDHFFFKRAAEIKNLLHFVKAHYSKSQIFVQKFNFDNIPTFSRVFHLKFFLTIFLVKSKLSTAKKPKNHNIFTSFSPKFFFDNFSREIKVVKS